MPFVPSSKAKSSRYSARTLTSLIRLMFSSPPRAFDVMGVSPEQLRLYTFVFFRFCLSNPLVVVKRFARSASCPEEIP